MYAYDVADYLGTQVIGKNMNLIGLCSLNNPKLNHLAFYKFDGPFTSNEPITVLVKPNIRCDCWSYIPVENPRLAHALIAAKFFADHNTVIPNGDGNAVQHRYPGAVIYDCVKWGEDCYFKPGSVIGTAGFGFESNEAGVPIFRPHIGGVRIGNNVQVGANSIVQRGTIDDTIIGDNVKIDDSVHFGHNCIVGENTIIAAGTVICGTVTIGKNCWIGANSTIMQHITIGDNVTIGVGANVVKSVPDNMVMAGFKAQPIKVMRKLTNAIETMLGL